MKRVKLCIVVLLVMVMFGGCAKTVDLTDEETDMFAEYISKEVLERDKYYDQELLAQVNEEDKEENEPEKNMTSTTDNGKVVTNVNYVSSQKNEIKKYSQVSVNDILGTSDVKVSYHSSKIYDSYPESGSDYFLISSNDGYELLVMKFDLENTTKKDAAYSMLRKDIGYKLTMSNGSTYNPLLTLLIDDLQFVDKVIAANDTQKGLLVFRIADKETDMDGTLQIVNGTKSAEVKIH